LRKVDGRHREKSFAKPYSLKRRSMDTRAIWKGL
jgi:hypothetical protein